MEIKNIFKLTNLKWLNIFEVNATNKKGKDISWQFVSRKKNPLYDKTADAVVIVPILCEKNKRKLVMIKEFRVPLNDYEYGFPAGLIEKDENLEDSIKRELKEETGLDLRKILKETKSLYSSPGLTDESAIVCCVEASGEVSNKYQESSEDIEVFLVEFDEILDIIDDENKKISAKTWGILNSFVE